MRAVKLLTLLALMSTGVLQAQYGWWGSQDTLNLYNRNMGSVMIGATQPLGKLTLGADDQMYNLSLIGDWSNMGKNYLRVGVMGNRSNNLQGHVLFDLTHSNGQARYAGYNFRVNGMSHFFINGDGNVGIGTEKPEARLDIKGGPDWYGFNVGMRMPKNNMIRFDAGQAQYGLVALEDEVSFVTSNGSPTAFGSMFSKRFSIQPRKTIIYGDLEVRGNIYSPGFNNGGGNGSGNPTGGGNGDGDSGKDYLLPPGEGDGDGGVATEYWTQDASMNLYYLPSTGTGSVAIGKTAPATNARLDILGNASSFFQYSNGATNRFARIQDGKLAFTRSSDGVETGLILYDGANKFTINSAGGASTGAVRFNIQTNGSDRMVINNEGSVGIGITTPATLLDVNGTAKFRGTQIGFGAFTDAQHIAGMDIVYADAGTSNVTFRGNRWGTNWKWEHSYSGGIYVPQMQLDNSTNALYLYNSATSVGTTTIRLHPSGLTYLNGGKVVIGSTLDQGNYTLAVKGTVKAQDLYLVATGWADFVFYPNYKLRTLEEVDKHIKKNGHLPDIPTEHEVLKNGVGVMEIQTKLLQKIEELTLYIIDQEKRLNKQEEKFTNQQNLIDQQIREIRQLKESLRVKH